MRILWVGTKSPWPPMDGGRLVAEATIRALKDSGNEVTLVAPFDPRREGGAEALREWCDPILVASAPRPLLSSALLSLPRRQPVSIVRHTHIAVREKVEEVIAFLGLERYRDTLIANLPYGVRKVVELGRALCIEPKLLLLDELSSGLNVEETEGMGYWIEDIKKDLGITVIMVEHDMNLVRMVSDRVMALNYGKVIALGTPGEVQSHPEVVRAYIGGDA